MNKQLRILHLEDDPDYCDLVHRSWPPKTSRPK